MAEEGNLIASHISGTVGQREVCNILYAFRGVVVNFLYTYVTGFAKRGLIHASNFATLMRHNFICGSAMKLKFTVSLV